MVCSTWRSTSLDLGRNQLGEAGGIALAGAVQSEHCRLTSLNLENTQLGEAAGIAFAGAVQSEHCRLTSLDLRGNELGEDARYAIKQVLINAAVDDPDSTDDQDEY